MSKLFKVTGIISFIACAGLLIYFLFNIEFNGWGILSVITTGILGLALIAVGDLMDRVDYLESVVNTEQPQNDLEEKIQQVTCPDCGKQYDMDYPKCPYCGHSLQ